MHGPRPEAAWLEKKTGMGAIWLKEKICIVAPQRSPSRRALRSSKGKCGDGSWEVLLGRGQGAEKFVEKNGAHVQGKGTRHPSFTSPSRLVKTGQKTKAGVLRDAADRPGVKGIGVARTGKKGSNFKIRKNPHCRRRSTEVMMNLARGPATRNETSLGAKVPGEALEKKKE